MSTSHVLYFLFLLSIGAGRLLEMRVSQRNRRLLLDQGAQAVPEKFFGAMVALHIGILVGSLIEVIAFVRPFLPALAIPMLILFALCNLIRWWVIQTLAGHWNVKVIDSRALGVVSSGPYRYLRHPNYSAVFLELIAVPLVHTAFLTALIGALLHVWVLSRRVRIEESVLLANPDYQASMGDKARFIPGVF